MNKPKEFKSFKELSEDYEKEVKAAQEIMRQNRVVQNRGKKIESKPYALQR